MKKDRKLLGIMSIPFYVHWQYHSNKVFAAVELKLQGQVQGWNSVSITDPDDSLIWIWPSLTKFEEWAETCILGMTDWFCVILTIAKITCKSKR